MRKQESKVVAVAAFIILAHACTNFRDGRPEVVDGVYGSRVDLSVQNTITASNARVLAKLISPSTQIFTGVVSDDSILYGQPAIMSSGALQRTFDRVSFSRIPDYTFLSRGDYRFIPSGTYWLFFYSSNSATFSTPKGILGIDHFAKKLVTINAPHGESGLTLIPVGNPDIQNAAAMFTLTVNGLGAYNGQYLRCYLQYAEISPTPQLDIFSYFTEQDIYLYSGSSITAGSIIINPNNKMPTGTAHLLCNVGSYSDISNYFMRSGTTYFTISSVNITNGGSDTRTASGFASVP